MIRALAVLLLCQLAGEAVSRGAGLPVPGPVLGLLRALWLDAGFAVVHVNYRGSTGYGSAWRDAIEGRPGLTELEDVAAVHDWAVSCGFADPATCVVDGWSWGGYLV